MNKDEQINEDELIQKDTMTERQSYENAIKRSQKAYRQIPMNLDEVRRAKTKRKC